MSEQLSLGHDGEPEQPAVPPEPLLDLSERQKDLLAAAVDIEQRDAAEVGKRGYSARLWAQVALPYRDPGQIPEWVRENGDVRLLINPGVVDQPDGSYQRLYPYGVIPRLLLTWLATQATIQRSPEIEVGDTLRAFLAKLGLPDTGYYRQRLNDQLERLFTTTMVVTEYQRDEGGNRTRYRGATLAVADYWDLWWTNAKPGQRDLDQMPLWQSKIELTEKFYLSIVSDSIPVDLRALGALRAKGGGGLAIDIYTWLAHRMSYLQASTRIPWPMLERQFGSQYTRPRAFKEKFLEQLGAVKVVYPEAKVRPYEHGLLLSPSPTPIAAAETRWRRK